MDYGGLDVGHLGAIYEGLLALRLSRASEPLDWDKRRKRYVPRAEPGSDGVAIGQLFFQTEAGGRKGAGVYYTPQLLVRHLVNHSVIPALEAHLQEIADLRGSDPASAARRLFEFRVLDPAMGSAHFLADALDRMADRYAHFLAEHALPGVRDRLDAMRREAEGAERVEDAQLLRRLILKRCVYGVDLSPMAVEIGRVSLWLKSFVPGMALSYLGHNLQTGDALVGVASMDLVAQFLPLVIKPETPVFNALELAAARARELADIEDRTPDDVARSQQVEHDLREAAAGVRRVFDLWTAEPFGVAGARQVLARKSVENVIAGEPSAKDTELLTAAEAEATRRHFFHWPAAFPEVFQPDGERPGFDAVVGNPPWNKVQVEEHGFYALHDPGLRGIKAASERDARVARLIQRFPTLPAELDRLRIRLQQDRAFFKPANGYTMQGAGHTDVFKLFCERYRHLLRLGGRIGVVLPRGVLLNDGPRGLRRWLFREVPPERVDFLRNRRRWAFDMEDRYTIALLAAARRAPAKDSALATTGPSASRIEFTAAAGRTPVRTDLAQLGHWTPAAPGDKSEAPSWEVPLLPDQSTVRVFARQRTGSRFDAGYPDVWTAFPVQGDLNETTHKRYYRHGDGAPVWKGRSFGRYDPHGRDPVGYAAWNETLRFAQDRRQRSPNFKSAFPTATLEDVATHPIHQARIAFRDAARATDSRTVIACLIPPKVFLTHKAPYLVCPEAMPDAISFVLGVLNSLPFDWQARRFVETSVAFFILNMLTFPTLDRINLSCVARRAGRLSCVDERFAEFAAAADVECGPLPAEERDLLRAEIDALVAHGYSLTADDLEVVFDDFTLVAVPPAYRDLVRDAYQRLA